MSTTRTPAGRLGRATLVTVLATVLCLLAYGVGWAEQHAEERSEQPAGARASEQTPSPAGSGSTDSGADAPDSPGRAPRPGADGAPPAVEEQPERQDGQPGGADEESESPTGPTAGADGEQGGPAEPSEPTVPTPGRALLGVGDTGAEVRDLQARLAQIDWFQHQVTGYYGDVTAAAVSGFQAKRGFAATGEVDRRTLQRLREMTTAPTADELDGTAGTNTPGRLDERCRTGRVLCVDKTSRTLRWVVDGEVLTTVDVRFGSEYTPTREGRFSVFSKSADHVSSLYDTPMPYAMFFSGGQAVHYSADFAAVGYDGASHGCVNVRDRDAIARLFDQVQVGDAVIVYWS